VSLTSGAFEPADLKSRQLRFCWSEAGWWAWEDLNLRPHPYQRSSPGPDSQDGTSDLRNDLPPVTAAYRSAPIGCGPNMDQGRPARRGSGAPPGGPWLARETPADCPRQASPAWAIALLGGALAGSGPGTSPCIGGLSLVSGRLVPQHPACSNHTHDGRCLGRSGLQEHSVLASRARTRGLERWDSKPLPR
jgi:hypothetical protein